MNLRLPLLCSALLLVNAARATTAASVLPGSTPHETAPHLPPAAKPTPAPVAPHTTPPPTADALPAGTSPEAAARFAAARKLANSIKYEKGDITLSGGVAKISIPPAYRYVNAAGASTILHDLWGNPGKAQTLGMIVPAGFDPMVEDNWAAVLSFDESGYVKDNDAAKIDYADLLKDMKKGAEEANEERVKDGYEPIALVGWAAPPRYDAGAHKLYWAKEIKFGNAKENTLNYNIRMLGRRGVLVVNVVGEMHQLKEIEKATPSLLGMVNFQEGHRYADFTESTDKVATYGLAALVAGGVAAKVGLFKGLWVAIIALKKFVIIGVIAVFGFLKRLFTGQKSNN